MTKFSTLVICEWRHSVKLPLSCKAKFPSEWEVEEKSMNSQLIVGFHSISFPSEWEVLLFIHCYGQPKSFHSISFPSEWEVALT